MRQWRREIILLTSAGIALAACATPQNPPEVFLSKYNVRNPHPTEFPVCSSLGCSDMNTVGLNGEEWDEIRKIFHPPPIDAEGERARVAQAVAALETLVGPQANTSGDRGRNAGLLSGLPQLDCVAETVNTTTYLYMIQADGLLTWHQLRYPQHRGLANLLWPHNTAVLVENATGTAFAVDSWFFDNGQPPEIVSIDVWIDGYDPKDLEEK